MRKQDIEAEETHRLIASDKVEGTTVYNREGEKLGTVKNFMVDKLSGKVEYAVMEFGGFLGMGESRHPLPWAALDYDDDMGGYVVNLEKSALEDAPHYEPGDEPAFDRAYGQRVHQYYGFPYGI